MKRLSVVNLDPQVPRLEPRHRDMLDAAGAELIEFGTHTEDEIIRIAADADAVLVASTKLTDRVIGHLRRCKVIGRFGSGTDNIDLAAATQNKIVVVYVPDFCVEEVSNHALLFVLAWSRQLLTRDADVRRGRWTASRRRMFHDIAGQTLGVIGFGRIGQCLARKARCLGMPLLVYDPGVNDDEIVAADAGPVDLETLLRQSDYVSLHVPLTPQTRGMIAARQLGMMKPTAYLINCARGEVVDELALIEALRSSTLAGAALDCLSHEPPVRDNPLFALDNVILTPHLAAHSHTAHAYLTDKTVGQVAAVLRGEQPEFVRNPEVLAQWPARLRRVDLPTDGPPSIPHQAATAIDGRRLAEPRPGGSTVAAPSPDRTASSS